MTLFPDEGQKALQAAYRAAGIEDGDLMPRLAQIAELAPMPTGERGIAWRRAYARQTKSILCNDFAHLVDRALANRYHPHTYAEMALQAGISTRHNPMVQAVDSLNRGVWPSASWRLLLNGQAQDEPRFQRLVDTGLDAAIRQAARLIWVHPAVCVMPWVATVRGVRKLVYRILSPDEFTVTPNPEAPGEWEHLCVFHPPVGGVERKVEWHAESIEVYQRRYSADPEREQAWEKVNESPNPFGVVPAVLFRRQRDRIWADNFGDMLRETTVEVNAAQTLMTYHGPTQIKLLFSEQGEGGKFQRLRQAMAVSAGGAGAAPTVVDLQLDISGFHDAYVATPLREVAVAMSLPPDEFDKTRIAPASGESIRLRYAERQQRQEEHRAAILPDAVSLYWMALHVLHVALGEGPVEGFDTVADLPPYQPETPVSEQPYVVAIDVADLTLPRLQSEREAEQTYNVEHGFSTWAQELAKEQPDLPNPEEVIKSNLQDTTGVMRTARQQASSTAVRVSNPLPPRV